MLEFALGSEVAMSFMFSDSWQENRLNTQSKKETK